jgi:cytochrome c-type biogenesis protein CcsB
MNLSQILLMLLAFVGFCATTARADAAADPFADQVDIKSLETLSVQHRQTLKTLDSYARQTVSTITGKSKLDGMPPLYTVLDIAYRPEQYLERNIIKIKHVPLRMDLRVLDFIDEAEKDRIVKQGTISLKFFMDPRVRQLLVDLSAGAVHKASAVQQLDASASTLMELASTGPGFPPIAVIPPATAAAGDHKWRQINEVVGNVPAWAELLKSQGGNVPPPLPGYESKQALLEKAGGAMFLLGDAWRSRDATAVNRHIAALAETLPTITAERYPSSAKRHTEVVYNRLAKLTLPGAALYFFAFVLLLLSARSGVGGFRLWGLRLFVLALFVHTLGIAIRWWLVSTTHGNWFDGIPIKNQFESALMSAWFGAVVGLILEMRRGRGIFGAAACFVGWLSLIAIFSTPYVFGMDIGGEIGQVSGVLMSYWLYIHVTMVVASYSLIGMGFLLAVWWLVSYCRLTGTILPTERVVAGGTSSASDDAAYAMVGSGGAALSLSFTQTLARMFFFPARAKTATSSIAARAAAAYAATVDDVRERQLLATLDACHLVVVQLAFWLLGVGIILGAVWADQSWGRPWGWDPKETFALVTWIVYLIVVHVRVATREKAWWTAVLSIVGFIVMLFNWIGVNFFLVGLHSYA